ncbi:MAG: class I SAM-dependent methyltransferase [Pseudomonadota bacterium]
MKTRRPSLTVQETCRSCQSPDLQDLIAFGETPIADRLVPIGFEDPQFVAPLTLTHCPSCALCQIRETVDPKVLFPPDYPYYSSVSPALVAHFRESAEDLIASGLARPGARIVEAASNDGYLLSVFKERGFEVLGIDPADGPASVAREKGIETIGDFFGLKIAKTLADEGRWADVFLANNVLAHVADTNDFVAGIGEILAPDGVAVIECPYLLDAVENCAFDTIYHQHLLFLSLTALVPLFSRHGLFLNDVIRVRAHGGSLRLFISKNPGQSDRLVRQLGVEAGLGVHDPAFYDRFLSRIKGLKTELTQLISSLKREGKRVVGYGAAAKATTLMYHFGLHGGDLEFIVDKSPWKHGMEMPGTACPIVPPEMLLRAMPDVVVVLAWNFAKEIIGENRAYLERGGRFVVPIPELRQVAGDYEGVSL